jgi:hypothetical protein
MAKLNFDASQVAPDTGLPDALPAGYYNVMVDESEMKPTKDFATSGSMYLQLRMNVLDGQFIGRKLFARFNLKNKNPAAEEIARKQLSAVAHAIGVIQVQDSQQLHGIPLKVKVKLRAASGDYEASNDIAQYLNINAPITGGPGAAGPAVGGGIPQGFGGVPAGFGGPVAQPQQQQPAAQGWAQPQGGQPWQQPGQPVQQQQQPVQQQPQQFQQPQTQQPQQQQFQQPVQQQPVRQMQQQPQNLQPPFLGAQPEQQQVQQPQQQQPQQGAPAWAQPAAGAPAAGMPAWAQPTA